MSRALPLAAAALAVALALIPTDAPGCAIAPGKGQAVRTATEQAVILYDEANRTEHFVRTASFTGTSADFGFLVPTPTKPEIAEADAGIYAALAAVTKPRVEVRKVKRSKFGIGCGAESAATFANVTTALAPGAAATVVEQKRVGNLDVAVLQADTPKALRDWLGQNGYDDRPELTDWLKPYTDGKWFLSCFKVAADVASPSNQTYAVSGTTVRMSFPTDRPFYPYREPADARVLTPPGGRMLRVYMLASTISNGVVGLEPSSRWDGRTVWAGQLPPDVQERATALAKVTNPGWAGKTLCLTEFEDRSSPRPGTDEIYFGPAADQSPVERPPHVVYETVDTTAQDVATFGGFLVVVALAFAVGLAALIRWMRKAV
jgi:hypothetical protein